MQEAVELGQRWARARRVVVLTGAGLSTASGIPDFRSPGGRWERTQPVPIQQFLASEAARAEYWRTKGETWRVIRSARPNPAHDALTRFAAAGALDLLVTQNVDGLHERSGFPPERLIRIHGSDAEVVCMACGAREPRDVAQRLWEAGVAVPRCACGGPWKPATISFGQDLVTGDLERAFAAAAGCDLFVAAGTSLLVGPVNQMFDVARRSGAATAIVTASDTPYDEWCQLRIHAPVEVALPAALAAARGSEEGGRMDAASDRLAPGDALLLVDVQNDFCPGGALPVGDGERVVAVLNRWIGEARRRGVPVYASQDWHPPGHPSFAASGGPWPPHCLQGTRGAAFHPELALPADAVTVLKGTRFDRDQLSAFDETGLAERLARDGVRRLWVGGLAQDVCVRASVLDALAAGFEVCVIVAGTRPVDEAAGRAALREMEAAGARLEVRA